MNDKLVLGNGRSQSTSLFLRIAAIWHIIVGVGALVGAVLVWRLDAVTWVRLIAAILLVITGGLSGWAAPLIQRREHRGRLLSLAINYLGFLVSFVSALHYLGFFLGIDSLANTFGKGIPYLGVILAGYLIGGFANREEMSPGARQLFGRVGKLVMAGGGIAMLLAVGIVSGFLAILPRLNTMLNIGLVFGALLFGIMAWLMWRSDSARAMNDKSPANSPLNG